jgi:hypothetical protein
MQNIEKTRAQILESVNIGQLLEGFKPSSMQGSTMKKNLVEAFNQERLNTVSGLAHIVYECNNLRHVDNNAFRLSEVISEKLGSSIKNQMVFCFESLGQMSETEITKSAKNTLENLIQLDESEIKNKIRSGALNPYRSISSVRFVIECTKIQNENHTDEAIHEAYTPVSYVETINENTYIRLGNKVIALNEHNLLLTKSPSTKFSYLSSVVEALQYNRENETFDIKHPALGEFMIGESGIQRKKLGSDEVLNESNEELIENLSMIIESKSSNAITRRQVAEQKEFVDALISLQENYDSIAQLDNSVVVENKQTKEKFALIVHEGKSFVGTLKSTRFPNVFESFSNINEALSYLQKRSGYDAKQFFVHEVALFESLSEKHAIEAGALKSVVEKLEAKRTEIEKMIGEEKSIENPSIEKINMLKESLSQLNGMIVEQKQNLQEYLNKLK